MNKVNTVKGLIASAMGVLNGIFGILAIPMILLVACNVIDYATGLMASSFCGQKIESYKGIKGILELPVLQVRQVLRDQPDLRLHYLFLEQD